MRNSLTMVRKHFPNVTKVVDAKSPIRLNVTKADNVSGRKKDPQGCALAKACVRQLKADGAIINISTSYIIEGDVATRYETSETVAREITSFDRHQDFAEGKDYLLAAITPTRRFGARRDGGVGGPRTSKKKGPIAVMKHRTENIRVSAM
jgi:hypothetical protein